MKQPTEQEIREFWEWCGFRYVQKIVPAPSLLRRFMVVLLGPEGKERADYPPIDLNNLFKYAVPEGEVQVIFHEVHWADGTILTSCELRKDFAQMGMATVEGKIKDVAALAFFWAIKQVNEKCGT